METDNSISVSEINININYETDAETVLDADTEWRAKKIRKLFYIYSGLVSGLLSAYMSVSWLVNKKEYLPYFNVGIIFNNLFAHYINEQIDARLKYDDDNINHNIWLAILLFVITGGIIFGLLTLLSIALIPLFLWLTNPSRKELKELNKLSHMDKIKAIHKLRIRKMLIALTVPAALLLLVTILNIAFILDIEQPEVNGSEDGSEDVNSIKARLLRILLALAKSIVMGVCVILAPVLFIVLTKPPAKIQIGGKRRLKRKLN
jgi:MFS family permease